eukprot:6476001-Amphidinium_carterae.1
MVSTNGSFVPSLSLSPERYWYAFFSSLSEAACIKGPPCASNVRESITNSKETNPARVRPKVDDTAPDRALSAIKIFTPTSAHATQNLTTWPTTATINRLQIARGAFGSFDAARFSSATAL